MSQNRWKRRKEELSGILSGIDESESEEELLEALGSYQDLWIELKKSGELEQIKELIVLMEDDIESTKN